MIWILKLKLRSSSSKKRIKAIIQLEKNGSPRAIETIIGALGDHNGWPSTVAENAARALGIIRAEQAIPSLAEAIRTNEEGEYKFKEMAALALAAIGTLDAIEALSTIIKEKGKAVNSAVFGLLEVPKDHQEIPRVVLGLSMALDNPGSAEESNAIMGLADIFWSSNHTFDTDLKENISAQAETILMRLPPREHAPSLLAALGNQKALIRYMNTYKDFVISGYDDLSSNVLFNLMKINGETPPETFNSEYSRDKWLDDWWLENREKLNI